MAESTATDVLKQFSQKITTSRVKTRVEIIRALHPCVKQSNFPEGAVKGIVRCLLFTLPIYQDKKSRLAVEELLVLLCQYHKDFLLKHFTTTIKETAELYKQMQPCRSNSAVSMNCLSWTSLVVRECFKTSEEMVGDNFKNLVELQCFLLHGAFATESASVQIGSYRRMARVWKQIPGSVSVYGEIVLKIQPSIFLMCMVSCVVKYLTASKETDQLSKLQEGFTELYVKQVVGTRTVPKPHVLEHTKVWLKTISHDTFKNSILPGVGKAMLRNPEVVITVLSELIAGVSLDLSAYCLELGKPLATHSCSKEERMREVATRAFSHLGHQCSDSGALEKLIKHLFAVLGGSEGKLTVAAQRVGLMTAIGNLSDNGVAGSSQQSLAGFTVETYIPVLQQEVHEATLVHAVSMFSRWCSKFSTKVPEKVTLWFKTAMSSKTSTPLVKNAYISCMNRTYHGDTLLTGLQILPCLTQALEKAYSQPSQVALVTEGLSAACLVAKMSLCDILAESKLETFWNVVLDADKMIFTNEKFLSQASDDALQCLATLVERLTLDHPQKVPDKQARQYFRGLIYCLTHGSYSQRKHSRACVTKMLSALGSTRVALDIVREFKVMLSSQKLEKLQELLASEESDGGGGHVISPRILTEAMLTITNIPSPELTEAEAISMETLFDAHHPCIVTYECDTWVDIVGRLGVDCVKFIEGHLVDIMADLKNTDHVSQSHSNALSTLVRISPKTVLPILLEYVTLILKNPDLLTIRHEDFEIMNTPEGELYDKSVIASGNKEEPSTANMKRENKLYSYKEQMAELELRKELEKKKAAKGGKTEPKLTKKQQEVMQEQLKKESEIRAKCKQLDKQISNMCLLLSACFRGNPEASRLEMPTLLSSLLPLFASPLAAPRVRDVYIELRTIVLGDSLLGKLVAQCTLRLLDASCALDPEWSEESLSSQATRAVQMLYDKTKPTSDANLTEHALSAPAFAYCFTLLRKVLEKGGASVSSNQVIMQRALSIISTHAHLRNKDDDDADVDEFGPELLPRAQMMSLCREVLSTSSVGKLQQLATRGLLDVAECGSGEEGCTTAEQAEVDVLLSTLQAPATIVREAGLLALVTLEEVLPSPEIDAEHGLDLLKRVYVAKFDVEEENRKVAEKIMEITQLQVESELCMMLVDEVVHKEQVVREAAAAAIANAIECHPDYVEAVLQELLDVYDAKLYQPPPVLDAFGRVISEGPPDDWPARAGIAMAIEQLAAHLDKEQITPVFKFFVDKSLGDRNETVRKHMLNAAVAAVNQHGKDQVSILLPVFEEFLADAPDSASFDAVRQSVVILMGSLAKHLDKNDPKVKPIVAKLIETLSTPSQQVQEAVANCLPPLVPAIKADAPGLIHNLLQLLLESENFGERKGAAYGLAGLVKGLGILALKQQDIMAKLTDAIQNKKNPKMREGALFAFEMLCVMLGRLFEPYVVHILPHLLLCFGDSSQFVREAAEDCAKAVMSKLSAHGVKLVLPSLLIALEEDSWRTKTGSVELLGAMAFCAPKQLSACLPNIVPKLTDVLTDSHLKVQKAGAQALKQIGSVIRNPEIQALVPTMLEALQDPTKKTTGCLQCLLDTKFVHFIDAPSLALIMPVVQRAFQDRSTETRKMAAQIIGNMYSLTDQKDLSPYLPAVIPGLKQSLLDPVPEVRTVSAKALGAMVKGMGESGFEELVPWLMQMLTSEQSSVDRSGAAQGLSEVVGGLGLEKLSKLMPDIIQTAERSDIAPHVRDGYIMMYIYLPTVFGEEFMVYIGPIIPSILQALSDENEYVRETALHAGQRLVNLYADTAIELLLPELEKGLFDDNWRIRSSSVQLLGDLLYKISGVSGKMSTESAGDDDNFGTESSQHAILRVLGPERRNRVLAGLYMGRSDSALMVRQSALHVWKVIVTHTPKTLREILSTLFELLLGCLASQSYDKRQVAARTLGDIVRKLGEKVLPEIIPILEKGLDSDDSDQRQGVCIGLSEIITSTSKEHVIVFSDSLIPTVRKALIDTLPEVRQCAAQTFDHLHGNIGPRALDEILPYLLKQLNNPDLSELALDGLRQVMSVKSRVVLPYLVPQLTAKPVNTRALSFLSSVAGEALTRHLGKILPALLSSLSQKIGSEEETQELGYCQAVVLSITDEVGVRVVMDELLRATTHDNSGMRCAAAMILSMYCEQTKMDLTEFVPQLYRGVIHCFIDTEEKVLIAAWTCVNAITKKLDPSEMLAHISNVRHAVKFAVSDLQGREELPGLCLPKKGITHLLPIFREGLLNGSPELKESSSYGLGELIRRASADALKPSVVNITGPLIRILGDRFSYNVKVAILDTLGLLLGKCGVMLKPFLPQLQTTFVKALNDATRVVRLKAAVALSYLIAIHTRVDPLFTELNSGVKNATDNSIRDTMLQALRSCALAGGSKMSDKVRKEILETLEDLLSTKQDVTRSTAAACLGAMCTCVTEDELTFLLNMQLLSSTASVEWTLRHGRSVGLAVALKEAPARVTDSRYEESVMAAVQDYCEADRIPISLAGLQGIGHLMRHLVREDKTIPITFITLLQKTMKRDSNDIKVLVANVINYVAKSRDSTSALDVDIVKTLVPVLVNGTKEKNTLVRSSSEWALVSLLRLRHGDELFQTICGMLEPGMRDVLNEVNSKALRKVVAQADKGQDDIDDTILV